MTTARDDLSRNVEDLEQKVAELEETICDLNAENEKLSHNLEVARSTLDLQGQVSSNLCTD